MATPTDRHRRLAAGLVYDWPHSVHVEVDDLEARIAQLLADQDEHRVPVQAVGAAYLRGTRETLEQVRRFAWDRGAGDVVAWCDQQLETASRPPEPLTAFRSWLDRQPQLDRAAVLAALDAYEGQQ